MVVLYAEDGEGLPYKRTFVNMYSLIKNRTYVDDGDTEED
jgi:hypothetical protein